MNLLVVGLSHHTAPVEVLERLGARPSEASQLQAQLLSRPPVTEAMVLATCNRLEVYAVVSSFHRGLAEVGALLAERTGVHIGQLSDHLSVQVDGAAVKHVLRVAAGLDSMVVGEAQILGQVRDAYRTAVAGNAAGRYLHELMQQALRVGKQVRTETGIGRAGQSVVSAALALVPGGVAGRPALVVGAGAMGRLALATLIQAGAGPLAVTNRDAERTRRVAESYGVRAVGWSGLAEELSTVDVVVSATASAQPVLTSDLLAAAGPLVVCDLAMPRDVAGDVAGLPGITVIDVSTIAEATAGASRVGAPGRDASSPDDRAAAEAIVAAEVEAFLGGLHEADVAPTVVALRGRADDLVAAELRRLRQRRPEFTDEQQADIARSVHRVVQRLLHQPTVRIRQLAATPSGHQYASVLRELFDLALANPTSAAVAKREDVS